MSVDSLGRTWELPSIQMVVTLQKCTPISRKKPTFANTTPTNCTELSWLNISYGP